MSSNVKDTIREALDIASQLAGIAGDWNLDEVEINGEMIAIYEVNDVFVAALAALAEPQPTIPPDVRETIRALIRFADTMQWTHSMGVSQAATLIETWLDAQGGTP